MSAAPAHIPSGGEQLAELLARVEACDDAFDRELDADIQATLEGGEIVWKQQNYTMESYAAIRRPSRNHVGGFANEPSYAVTSSLDAATALVSRVLPGWSFLLAWNGERSIANVYISPLGVDQRWAAAGEGRWPALALVAALLRALIARPSPETAGVGQGRGNERK